MTTLPVSTVIPASSTAPLPPFEEREMDIVEKNTKVIQIAKSALASFLVQEMRDLVERYLFVDLTMIYKEAGIVFNYIPKSLSPSRDPAELTPAKREKRVLLGSEDGDIFSRLHREFAYAQAEMVEERSKAFVYRNSDLFPLLAALPNPLTEMEGYSVGAFTFVGRRGHKHESTPFEIWDESFNQDRYVMEELRLIIGDKNYSVPFAAVFDGHGNNGVQISEYAVGQLKTVLLKTLAEHNLKGLSYRGIWTALKLVGVNFNTVWADSPSYDPDAGTTILFFIELMDMVYVVNVGDSRGVLNNKGIFIQLTDDAKPQKDRFKKSIENRGGTAHSGGLDGVLGTARSAGDFNLDGHVSARSKITMLPSLFLETGSDIILTSDGVFDVGSTVQVLRVDEEHPEQSPDLLAKNVVFSSLATGSTDNLTAVVIRRKERKVREVT